MEQRLTAKDKKNLVKRHRKERDGKVRDRIKAVLAYDEGYSYSEIARILLLDDETIRRHIRDYYTESKLSPENGGSESKLSAKATAKLVRHLAEVTYLYVKAICAYVKTQFGCRYSVSGMREWLHAHGFRHKKPHGVPAKADKEQQALFIDY